jgi:CBS domain-containing protein
MIVDSLMHRPVVAADAGTPVREAALLMERHRVGCLVVTRGEDVVGIVTERDVVFRVVGAGRDPQATRLQDVMSAPVAWVSPETSVDDAASLMKRLRVKRLVVMREGEARGVISVTDIAYASPEASRAMLDAWVKQRWED